MQSGFLLVTAIFLLVILAALGAFILTISGTQQTSSALDVQGARAYQAARAGIEWASDQVLIGTGGCAGYSYFKSITVDRTKVGNVGAPMTLSSFPMLYNVIDANLKTTANGGHVTSASGFDIIFKDSGGTMLDHEIEKYVPTTGEFVAWVRVPTLNTQTNSSNTVINICYGNSSVTTSQENKNGVWDTNFKGVWHLKETSGQHQDSTSNAHTSSAVSVTTQGSAPGRANGADDFGANQKITFPDSADWDLTVTFTLEAWVNGADNDTAYQTVVARNNAGNTDWDFALVANRGASAVPACYYDGPPLVGINSSVDVNPNAWTHIVCVWDGSTEIIYVDGVFRGSSIANPNINNTSNPLFIGDSDANAGDEGYVGVIDEVRISNSARSADWVKTEYNNQSSPSTFYTLGTETTTTCNTTLTGMGGTLSGFTAAVTCSSTTYTEGGATVTVYQITSNGFKGAVGTLDRVERELQATLTK